MFWVRSGIVDEHKVKLLTKEEAIAEALARIEEVRKDDRYANPEHLRYDSRYIDDVSEAYEERIENVRNLCCAGFDEDDLIIQAVYREKKMEPAQKPKEYHLIWWEENKSGNSIVVWITENCLHSIYLQPDTDFVDFHRVREAVDVSPTVAQAYVDDMQGHRGVSENESYEFSKFDSHYQKQFTSLFVGRLDLVFEAEDAGETLFSEREEFSPDIVNELHENKYWYRFYDDVANVYGGPYDTLFDAIRGLYNDQRH